MGEKTTEGGYAWDVLGTPEVMRRLGELMAEAERLADTPQAKARVANWRAGVFDYMCAGAAEWRKRGKTAAADCCLAAKNAKAAEI